MTDSKTVVEDLAAWLTAVWDEDAERLSSPYFCGPVWPTTDELLARIAADRKILELHAYTVDGVWVDCANCGEVGHATKGIRECLHRRLLAAPYESRPDFRSEWLVERQGVEG